MSSAPGPEEIARDATWLVQALDPTAGTVRLIAMDREAYRNATFLDDRLLQSTVDAQIMPWPDVEAAVADESRDDARWIFHIGHVGSTLVSRLLGEIDGILSVREPRILRDLAVIPPQVHDRYVASVPKLMSRTFAVDETACVKATSFASEIAPRLVPPGEHALLMYARPRNYIASILAGENSLKELKQLTDFRGKRLSSRGIILPGPRNDAERAAAAWACEMTTLEAAAAAMTDRQVEWADFDTLLGDMAAGLERITAFFGFTTDIDRIAAIAGGPLMHRYSKALEYEYSPRLREELIEQELRLQGQEIDTALAMLSDAAAKSPLVARALARAED
jgi:hypothetical protein